MRMMYMTCVRVVLPDTPDAVAREAAAGTARGARVALLSKASNLGSTISASEVEIA